MQFYLGSWMHMRGVCLSQMDTFALEPLNFADDIVRGDNFRKRAILKNRSEHCL